MDMETKEAIADFLKNKVETCSVLVFGDVMLDRYFYGDVARISPEAPVPVNRIEEKKDTLGGAANVAHNLARLGVKVTLAGIIGDDHHGRVFMQKLKKFGIDSAGIYKGRQRTTTKIRILGGHQQMIRLDFEETEPITDNIEQALLRQVQQALQNGVQAIVLSDYGKGLCTEKMCQDIIHLAREHQAMVFVDPKGRCWEKYADADYITPNVKETSVVVGETLRNEDSQLRVAAKAIRERYQLHNVMITRSERGITLFSENGGEINVPTLAQEVFDVSGAGDTVISAFAAAVCGGMSCAQAVYLANYAAGIEVGHLGTYAVSSEEILQHLDRA
ncbi:MAG: D-glycero-beta-D-manno-heptose-7-phosphate kinase [Selenomonadaceae bacterium]|nr:D-glycero-beta-D-manno-heptose-7-phosphate kinase [Selenomonadaceae bacterium]